MFDNFEKYLIENNRKIVGYACDGNDCPINRFLCNEFGLKDIKVGKFVFTSQGKPTNLPRVISRFITDLDSFFYSPARDKKAERVFGSQALKIWRKVNDELQAENN